jgi:hypothetical protein
MKSKLYVGNMIHPEDSSIKQHFDTTVEFRPELWCVRKAICLLADKHPTSAAVDMKLLVTGKPFHTEEDWYDGYSTEICTFIWQLYLYFDQKVQDEQYKLDKTDTILMWVIRCFHYYWLSGPKPSGIHKPRREYNKGSKEEAFRTALECSACHQPFTYPDIATDLRMDVMRKYNSWLYEHIQVCTVVHKDISTVLRKAESKAAFLKEQKEREELELHRYEEWKKQQMEGLVHTPSVDEDQVEHDAFVLRQLVQIKKLYNKNLVSAGNRKLHALSMYNALAYDRHIIITTEDSRDKMNSLAKEHGVLLVKYGKKFPKVGKFFEGTGKVSPTQIKFNTDYQSFKHPVVKKESK